MDPSGSTRAPSGAADAEQVADLLEVVYQRTFGWPPVDRIASSRVVVSQTTTDRFVRLADELRPGAPVRVRLGERDPELLLAGGRVRTARRVVREYSAAVRAQVRWSGCSA